MVWSLYSGEKFLEPLCFSNGKNQAQVVEEVLKEIGKGHKVIFIRGVCGTGKSAIALNIARNLGKTSIVVPGKNLQTQYKKDYEHNKYLLKENGERLKISVITGRKNHACRYSKENKIITSKREINTRLDDIFSGNVKEKSNQDDESADRNDLPCKIEIKEKNMFKIKEYLKQNKNINHTSFNSARDVRRVSVAAACPYWSPVLPEKYELKGFEENKKRTYLGLNNMKFTIHQGKRGCPFYEQFNSYIDSDIIVFNSMKYKLESALKRKPFTEVEIIDECDEFLDSFSNQKMINIDKMQNSLIELFLNDDSEKVGTEINETIKELRRDRRIEAAIISRQILPIKETPVHGLIKIFLDNSEILSVIDEENYLFEVEEAAKMFEDFLDETYVTFEKKENNLFVSLVTTNLAKKFKEMVDKNKNVVLMSGTLHSEEVLKKVFGLDDFKIIEAEVQQQGQIDVMESGKEMDCKYDNFSNGKNSRKDYLEALNKCVEISKKPTLVHVNSFSDLPNEREKKELELNHLITREELEETQGKDNEGKEVEKFKKGEIEVLFSTRASRGIDFPGEQCNSIVFTKYPYPNVQDAFWKILKQTKPDQYWGFYKDKAKRELLQKIYRGLRYAQDHVYVLSPDSRVLKEFKINGV